MRRRCAAPEVGAGSRRRRSAPEVGAGVRRRRSAPEVGAGSRRRCAAPEVGAGSRRRCAAPVCGAGGRRRKSATTIALNTRRHSCHPWSRGMEPAEWTQHEMIKDYISTLPKQSLPMPLVVQFGSDACALCPKATLDIDCAKKSYNFEWKYEDVLKSDSGFAEELGVTALPALLVLHDVFDYTLYQKLRGTDVTDIIKTHCQTRLVLDEDF